MLNFSIQFQAFHSQDIPSHNPLMDQLKLHTCAQNFPHYFSWFLKSHSQNFVTLSMEKQTLNKCV